MNETTILVWVNIAIIGIIAIIVVKLYFRKDELEKDDSPLIPKDSIDELVQSGKNKIKNSQNSLSKSTPTKSSVSTYFSKQNQQKGTSLRKKGQIPEDNFNSYIVPETSEHKLSNKTETNNKEPAKPINFNYETKVQKFQEPINETQMDIMSKNNENAKRENVENNISMDKKPKHELKDLFSIDELIKESKRKDDEREKESKTIKKEKEDTTEIKESIKQMKAGKREENLITEIKEEPTTNNMVVESKKEKDTKNEVNLYDIIKGSAKDEKTKDSKKIKDSIYNSEGIADAIKSSKEEETSPKDESVADILAKDKKEEAKDNSTEDKKEKSISDVLLEDKKEDNTPDEENVADILAKDGEIKTPNLKSPTKIETDENELSVLPAVEEDYEFGAPLEESELFKEEETTPEENTLGDLDYRKDLAKITNHIKNSKIFNEVKEKLAPERSINEEEQIADEMYLRNVNTYKEEMEFPEYEPIINERHEEYPSDYDYQEPTQEQLIRQENTRKVFNMAKSSEAEETSSTSSIKIKEKPERNNIKITLNNEDMILRKGAEIIFKHDGESYSSKVYGIRGNEISVKYRGKNIIITPKDIKKVY
jgi:hypothetical protein